MEPVRRYGIFKRLLKPPYERKKRDRYRESMVLASDYDRDVKAAGAPCNELQAAFPYELYAEYKEHMETAEMLDIEWTFEQWLDGWYRLSAGKRNPMQTSGNISNILTTYEGREYEDDLG